MSTKREGALAEIAFHWSQFYPLPSKPAALHRIGLTARRTIQLLRADLVDLGVDWARWPSSNLGIDGVFTDHPGIAVRMMRRAVQRGLAGGAERQKTAVHAA